MLQSFRSALKSKVGAAVAIGFLVLIAVAFASADITGTNFGGVAGGDRVATVGKERVDTATLSQAASSALENLKAEDPTLSMKSFLAQDGLARVLEEIIDRTALAEFGRLHGIVAGARLVDSEIAQMDAFKGPDGKFSEAAFRQALQQQGISEALVRSDLAQGLVARQLLVPAAFGARVPEEMARRYATLLRESRSGSVALLPAAAFAPRDMPTDTQLQEFYTRKSGTFIRPERRVIRYAVFGEDALKTAPAPTDAEIAARYEANKAKYAASELRRVTQLIVPTEAAAKAIVTEVAAGTPLEKAAAAKGLAVAGLEPLPRDGFAGQSSQAVADAVFAASRGAIATPARSGLGWHIVRIDAIDSRPQQTLEQVRGELTTQLAAEKRRAAINDLSARIEEEFDNGGTLADTTKDLALTIESTPAITADGAVYGAPERTAPPVLQKVLATAFAMEKEGEPQLAEVEAGKTFLLFDVTDIQPSAPAPLAEIRNDVIAAWMLEKGAAAARAAANKVIEEARKGKELGAAVAGLGVSLPPVQPVAMPRQQLAAMQAQGQVPPPLALMFSMAAGTVKMLAAPGDQGWYLVALKSIEPGRVDPKDPIIAASQRELGAVSGREYAEALRRAIRAEVGVERNEAAIKAVRTQLNGGI